MHRRALWLGLTLVAASYVRSQTTIAPALPAEGIRVSAFAEQSTVPLNRTVPVTIRLEWQGDLDRYEIIEVENLTAQNFEVVGNSSANRVAVVDGRNLSVHDFQYTLRPMSLGMGYVNGLTVRYADAGNGKQYRLFTNRVEIRVVDPVAEPGAHDWLYYLAAALLLLAALVYVFVKLQKKKKQEAEKALAWRSSKSPSKSAIWNSSGLRFLWTAGSWIPVRRCRVSPGCCADTGLKSTACRVWKPPVKSFSLRCMRCRSKAGRPRMWRR